MFDKKHISIIEETLPEDEVHFKPIFGVRPGVYLAGVYGTVLAVILFFVLLYPGLAKPGTLFSLSSEPSGAAVRADNVYIGATPCEVFIPKGTRQIEMVLPGFEPYRRELDVKSRLFGSLLFPRRDLLAGSLPETAAGEALRLSAGEYGVWSFTGEPTATRQIPQVLSEGAYRSGPNAEDPSAGIYLEGILKGAARFASTRAGIRDLVRAKCLTDNAGVSTSPVSAIHSLEDMLVYLSEVPGAAQWLAGSLPPETSAVLADSSWYAAQNAKASEIQSRNRLGLGVFGETVAAGGLAFREISEGTLIQGGVFPREIPIMSFSIAETPVSLADWTAFTQANPEWDGEQSRTLTAKGLVTSDYLGPGADAGTGVSGVSWYAAKAYCQWLTSQLSADFAEYEVRLPTEAEWEYAAKSAELTGSGPKGMGDGLWEWCADPYTPHWYLPADPAIIEAIGSPERSVRGGIGKEPRWDFLETRGSLFPAACSPFGVFRPVLAKKSLP
ncbi:MAG: SUMF1/EgtB/PvdO family nonheme iron enzyme [Spirochaetaceae bacterium]|jgi:hypothetical protein|nr:SUMF1/EgtB/PvdO family nonheme iron enzyme [Spirochaetaceae bacterium]